MSCFSLRCLTSFCSSHTVFMCLLAKVGVWRPDVQCAFLSSSISSSFALNAVTHSRRGTQEILTHSSMAKCLSSSQVWSPCIQSTFQKPSYVEGEGQVHDNIQGTRTIMLWAFVLMASPALVPKPAAWGLRQAAKTKPTHNGRSSDCSLGRLRIVGFAFAKKRSVWTRHGW